MFIDVSDVTCVEPAIAQGAGIFLWSFLVAQHNLGTSEQDFAFFPDRQLAFARLYINDPLLGVMNRQANIARVPYPFLQQRKMGIGRGLG
jgi:hypothetical protein